jgi:3-keto-disaccharide hydrolase
MQKIAVLHVMSKTLVILGCATLVFSSLAAEVQTNWVSLFYGKDLTGWTVRGKAAWSVQRGVLVGVGGMGHIYTDAMCSDFEAKGFGQISS